MPLWNRLLREYCELTGIDPDLAGAVVDIEQVDSLPSNLPTTELATGAVAAASLAGALLAAARAGRADPTPQDIPAVRIEAGRVGASFTNDRLQRVDGQGADAFAPLSGFWAAQDGWVRTHANYAHHRERLLAALDLPDDCDRAALVERCRSLPALAIEDRVVAERGIATAVRTLAQWRQHPQAAAIATLPLLGIRTIGEAPPRQLPSAPNDPLLPAAGLRVLDLTRVIAGPVATRTLALLGAQVLRIDPPAIPEIVWQHLDTGAGKRSALLDLRSAEGRSVFDQLLADADVVVTGYRPGALDTFGLTPAELAARRPGIVVASLSAWGDVGPWCERRGFDSIVQAASGIAVAESADGERPGALPAQALDHATGYLIAAGVLHAVAQQMRDGASRSVQAHLARTGHWLTSMPDTTRLAQATSSPEDFLVERQTPSGLLRYASPAVRCSGSPADYATVGGIWAADQPVWA